MSPLIIILIGVALAATLLFFVLGYIGTWSRFLSIMSGLPMRVFLGVILIGVALAAGLAFHNYKQVHKKSYGCNCTNDLGIYSVGESCSSTCYRRDHRKPSWADPAAIIVVFAGLGVSAGLVAGGLRRSRD